jgi:16S rRNA (uracil1498-N3)-methyltransferase
MTEAVPAAKIRLFVEADLAAGGALALTAAQAHYLGAVMRRRPGDAVALFNGRDGEWAARIEQLERRGGRLALGLRLRPQAAEPGPVLWFAPLKRARLELLVEKATELGAAGLAPVLTRRTVVERLKPERLRALAIEAAEQCGRLTLPTLASAQPLAEASRRWPAGRPVFLGDEQGGGLPLLAAFAAHGPGDLLIGPEGGFAPDERQDLLGRPMVVPVDLGPLILRAETAALLALACWRAQFGTRPVPAAD